MSNRIYTEDQLLQAKRIVKTIADHFKVSLDDVVSGRRYAGLPYLRKLMIYAIRNDSQLQFYFLTPIVGLNSRNSAAMYYREVMSQLKNNGRLRADVITINKLLAA